MKKNITAILDKTDRIIERSDETVQKHKEIGH